MENQITISKATQNENWQELLRMENGYLREIGEQPLTGEQQAQLFQAIQESRITFFLAKSGKQTVGMCSVACHFSTFSCTDTGVFEDFYVEPAYRKRGIARALAQAAHDWSRKQGLSSLTVCCAPCDEQMYQSLGFDAQLGKTYAKINDFTEENK